MLKHYHQHIYYYSLLLLVVSLPLSPFLLSVAQIVLLANWILENNFKEKRKLLSKRKSILAFVVIYLIHIAGLIYTSDFVYGFHDLKIKLPLLILPLILGTSQSLPYKRFLTLLLFFIAAIFTSSLISTGNLFGWWGKPVMDIRDISMFISHIRLGLMVNMSIFLLAWFIFQKQPAKRLVIYLLLICWFAFFLVLLKSLTGIIIFLLVASIFSLYWTFRRSNLMAQWFIVVGMCSVVLIGAAYLTRIVSTFYHVEQVSPSELEKTTASGNNYSHYLSSKDFENGHLTWIYVCEKELADAWNKRSLLRYTGTDMKGQELRYTLIRYLTSKGLRKDSTGVMALEEKDVKNIELGMANHIYSWKFSLYPRIYQLLWEINKYKNAGNPSGHSFTQRMEYMKTAMAIIRADFWFGVGTGDVASAFRDQYQKANSVLEMRWRLRAHNQFVTFFLTFGLIGCCIITAALFYPIFAEKKWNNYFMGLFLIIGFISFLNEDTLETQAGISFFVFFYALFLYNTDFNNDKTSK